MVTVSPEQVALTIFSGANCLPYSVPYGQRPPEPIYPIRKRYDHQTSMARITSSDWRSAGTILDSALFANEDIYTTIRQQQNVEILQILTKIKESVCNPATSTDIDSISETIDDAYELIVKFGPNALNFDFIDGPEKLNGEHLAALLRVTYVYKKQIQGWDNALASAINALEIAQLDVNDALAGLTQC